MLSKIGVQKDPAAREQNNKETTREGTTKGGNTLGRFHHGADLSCLLLCGFGKEIIGN